jgi:hypothetical protein
MYHALSKLGRSIDWRFIQERFSRSIDRRLLRDVAPISTSDCGRNRAPPGQSLRSACRRRFGRNAAGVGPVSNEKTSRPLIEGCDKPILSHFAKD